MYLLDTDVIIDFLRKRKGPKFYFQREKFFISAMSVLEVEYGFKRRPQSAKSQGPIFSSLLDIVKILTISDTLSETFAITKKELFDRNQIIGNADLIIGSQAIYHNLTLVTRNLKDFGRISSLKILDFSPYLEGEAVF